jgi:hypothetical protein
MTDEENEKEDTEAFHVRLAPRAKKQLYALARTHNTTVTLTLTSMLGKYLRRKKAKEEIHRRRDEDYAAKVCASEARDWMEIDTKVRQAEAKKPRHPIGKEL